MSESGVLWVVGRTNDDKPWEFMGVFSTQGKAEAACTTDRDFVGRTILDRRAPEEEVIWPGAYYPLAVSADQKGDSA